MSTKHTPMQVRITESVILRQSFETASWFRDIKVESGIYPMNFGGGFGATRDHHFVDIPGVVIGSAFPSSFGGHQFGDGNRDKDIGQSQTFRVCFDPESFWEGKTSRENGKLDRKSVV